MDTWTQILWWKSAISVSLRDFILLFPRLAFRNSETPQLAYLNTQQALADIASFILTQNKNLNLTDSKWILFGGSYAGSLALWFREVYPELCAGAVGSSAPVQPKLDFYG